MRINGQNWTTDLIQLYFTNSFIHTMNFSYHISANPKPLQECPCMKYLCHSEDYLLQKKIF